MQYCHSSHNQLWICIQNSVIFYKGIVQRMVSLNLITFLAKVIQYCLVGRKFRHILKTCYTKREYFSCNPTFKSDNFVEVQIFLWSTFPWTILFWVWQITGILKTVTFGINIALAIANIKANNFFLHWLKYDILCITGSGGVSL